jgi:hypothetical protein
MKLDEAGQGLLDGAASAWGWTVVAWALTMSS